MKLFPTDILSDDKKNPAAQDSKSPVFSFYSRMILAIFYDLQISIFYHQCQRIQERRWRSCLEITYKKMKSFFPQGNSQLIIWNINSILFKHFLDLFC